MTGSGRAGAWLPRRNREFAQANQREDVHPIPAPAGITAGRRGERPYNRTFQHARVQHRRRVGAAP